MAKTYRTPGVYVQEISTLPGSVAEVQSAIPAFIGYTQKIRYDGRALVGIPERIASLKDFEERFGRSSDVYLNNINITINKNKQFSQVDSISFSKRFLLYESIYMYFINGGGECYVVSIGSFEKNKENTSYDPEPFKDAIDSLNMVDEITLIVLPEAVLLGESLYGVQQKVLDHCATRMSRFAIFDIKEEVGGKDGDESILLNWKNNPEVDRWEKSYKEFRDKVGVMNLSYGAAYTPYIIADTPTRFGYKDIKKHLKETGTPKKQLFLSDLDPAAHDAVKYLDNAIQDQTNMLEAIKSAKEMLIGKDAVAANDNLSLGDAVVDAYTNEKDKKDIVSIGNILSGLLYSLAPSSPPEGVKPDPLVEAFKGSVKNLKDAVDGLFIKDEIVFADKKRKAIELVNASLEDAKKTIINTAEIAEINEIKIAIEALVDDNLENNPTFKTATEKSFAMLQKSLNSDKTSEKVADKVSKQGESGFPQLPLTNDLVRCIRDSVARLVPEVTTLCEAGTKATGADELAKIASILGKIKAENVQAFANLLDFPLANDIGETITKNIERLSDGLFGTSSVYRFIHAALQKALRVQPASASMAGLYAATDNARGVWKAPANVSVSNCLGLTQTITSRMQEELNIDSVAGKSINAIRSFPGKGYLVWGARTLDGNSQEWRYIPVRRFFIMVEESVRRATAASVFEPNDSNLWVKVQALIDNYLLQKWKDGALMGVSAADAYFVNIGLGSTMTEQDILDGRLIVDIGMAVVRPAEFIILRFMHKMQQ